MPNFIKPLKEEIARIALHEAKVLTDPIRKETTRLRKAVADLRKQVAVLQREKKKIMRTVRPVIEAQQEEKTQTAADRLRITSNWVKNLRKKLNLSQAALARLADVTPQSILNWENGSGKLNLRAATLAKLAEVRNLGRREADKRLEALAEEKKRKKTGKKKTGKKKVSKKKTAKKVANKKARRKA
jgi:transcriptional regulator with XRE-family HTH domain